ncbi:MAG: type II toxin-antitoxin system HigB family toxin [Acidobacteriota bacterium]
MRIISRKRIGQFCAVHPDAKEPLETWFRVARKATWRNLTEVHQTYPHADLVGICTIFNIKGNHYRLITKINYLKQTIYIRFILTHSEYDKGGWHNGCGCG